MAVLPIVKNVYIF